MGTGSGGREAGLGDRQSPFLVTGPPLCSLSLNPGPVPHFWELCPCWVSCSGPQFFPGTAVLSLKSSVSLAGSQSPAASLAPWAADPPPHSCLNPETPGATVGVAPLQGACQTFRSWFSLLGGLRQEGRGRVRNLGKWRGERVRVGAGGGSPRGAGSRPLAGDVPVPSSPCARSCLGLGCHATWPGTFFLFLFTQRTHPHPSGLSLDPRFPNFLCHDAF